MRFYFATLSRYVELLLWLIALIGISVTLFAYGEGWLWQAYLHDEFRKSLDARVASPALLTPAAKPHEDTPTPVPVKTAPLPYIARLEIPRLDLSVMVLEGVDNRTLLRGIGHIPGTAFPGQTGNTGIAGHRDSFFRHLGVLQKNDRIVVTTTDRTFKYSVQSIRIVGPKDVGVLDSSGPEALTLITCYPFYFLGPAPQRFIVRALRTE